MNTKKKIRTLDALTELGLLENEKISDLSEVIDKFSLSITDQMYQLIDKNDPQDPIAKQFIPTSNELNIHPQESWDPIGDNIHMAVKGIIHRYPDRCLFLPVHVCPVYCRFCFRKEKVGDGSQTLTPEQLDAAFDYIAAHKEIWEVIITGGDPLILKPSLLKKYIDRLNAIEHIEIIRIHTRVPVVDSARINEEMVAALKSKKPVYVLLHANHPKEFTPEAVKACAALVDAGIPMLSQTILLKDLNADIETLSTLMRCFIKNRIKPYYLHHADYARGTQHFRTSIAEGQALMKQLRGRFSGICQPTYVLDIPDGFGKVPIGPGYLTPDQENQNGEMQYFVEDYCGNIHSYPKSKA